jgi:hypothetical protein
VVQPHDQARQHQPFAPAAVGEDAAGAGDHPGCPGDGGQVERVGHVLKFP